MPRAFVSSFAFTPCGASRDAARAYMYTSTMYGMPWMKTFVVVNAKSVFVPTMPTYQHAAVVATTRCLPHDVGRRNVRTTYTTSDSTYATPTTSATHVGTPPMK